MNTLKALLLIATALVFAGCASTPDTIGGKYALVSLTGVKTTTDEPIIINVSPTSISGSGPVNQWRAPIEDGEVGMIISTRRAGPPQLMQLETQLINALEGAEFESGKRETLTFKKKREVTAVFQYVDSDTQ